MPPHRVTGDADALGLHGVVLPDEVEDFRDVVVHPEVRRPWSLRGVDVETGSLTEVVLGVVRYPLTAGARVRAQDREAELGGDGLKACFRGRVFPRTREPRQVH